MVVFLTLLVSSLFSLFFFAIDLRYFSLFPLLISCLTIFYNFKDFNVDLHFIKWGFSKYNLYFIRCFLMIGLSGMLSCLWVDEITVFLSLIAWNIFLRILSYFIEYQDGKLLFEIGSYLLIGIFLLSITFYYDIKTYFSIFLGFATLLFALFAFFLFIMKTWREIPKRFSYQFVCFGILVIILSLFKICSNIGIWFLLSFSLLWVLYFLILKVQRWVFPKQDTLNISVRKILAWERINKKFEVPEKRMKLQQWLLESPQRFHLSLETPNLILLIIIEGIFLSGLITQNMIMHSVFYFLWIALFLINSYLLKKNLFVSKISSFAIAFVINLFIYSLLLYGGRENIWWIMPLLIIWSIFCKIALFYLNRFQKYFLFDKQDYYYWTIISCISSGINVILLSQLSIPGQLLFFLIFIYWWLELFLIYYILKILKNSDLEDDSLSSEEENL